MIQIIMHIKEGVICQSQRLEITNTLCDDEKLSECP